MGDRKMMNRKIYAGREAYFSVSPLFVKAGNWPASSSRERRFDFRRGFQPLFIGAFCLAFYLIDILICSSAYRRHSSFGNGFESPFRDQVFRCIHPKSQPRARQQLHR
jgi:hypothetical protein